ncbi:MAG TPA: DUF883 C-terminal domain-containing protein [Pyrinomonadaceae bacterium]|jgi:ElaB/YqjD/DUF883 family membrane-anchored ribosome-binding protein|nr:DUF883 C-terminal domain-containing protein [Pyrinomonadaceae bacterium]
MSQNRTDNETTGSFGTGGGTSSGTSGKGSTGTGSTGTSNTSTGISTTGGSTGGGAATGTAAAPASGITAKAKEYGQTVADAASQAKDYIADKASVVGDKFQDLRNVDYGQLANDAKDYARQNPGQALLVAAAAGFVIGLLVRGGRR